MTISFRERWLLRTIEIKCIGVKSISLIIDGCKKVDSFPVLKDSHE